MKVSDMFEQAPTRFKETLELARALLNDRLPKDPMDQANQKILATLRKLGVATQAEVQALEERLETLEAELQGLRASGKDRRISS